ncbi:MAG TPA: branched-chain alpha-keto acid dehydrogenase subunit E2 [Candidatus Omnitrophica bacterium]|nr:MAG: branched-chain alpha-keto acid dehydrogenase subunit E2 [Omnitrophica WOR_2 bacterium GWA2_53_43]HCI44641.1 branched-chain alpha-keto acid dehydrogenase subunit E2 [Candidatus Omnitrophota bacterium]
MLDFKLPEVGENIKSGNIVAILVAAGDVVKKDQPLLEMETDKASLEIPSPCDGTIKEILIKKGEDVKIGQVVMRIAEGKTSSSAAKATPKEATQSAPMATVAAAKESARSTPAVAPSQAAPAILPEAPVDVPAAPSVRRFAREIGINIAQVPGTSAGGRISIEDVKAFAKALNTGRAAMAPAGAAAKPLPDFSKWGVIDRRPMSNIRKKTAEHMSFCWSTIPHVTQFDKADITGLEQLRKKFSTPDRKLTVTPFLLKVLAAALKTFPEFNASIDMTAQEIVYKKYCHIGVAVDTDRGLIVPVLRDVDKKTIFQLADELNRTAQRAREKKISLDELQGGSMTVTNLGGIGGTQFTPIVNWPEAAILGVSRAQWEPFHADGKPAHAPRFMLPLSLSYDHRLIDGANGARFLRWVCEAVEQPFMMELEK